MNKLKKQQYLKALECLYDDDVFDDEVMKFVREGDNLSCVDVENAKKYYRDIIENLIEEYFEKTQWIPVENRLPKQIDKNGDMVSEPVFVTIYDSAIKKYLTMIDCMVEGEWTEEKFNKNFKVTAWMPKPKRYGGNENE